MLCHRLHYPKREEEEDILKRMLRMGLKREKRERSSDRIRYVQRSIPGNPIGTYRSDGGDSKGARERCISQALC